MEANMWQKVSGWFCDKVLFWYVLTTGFITCISLLITIHTVWINNDKDELIYQTIHRCSAQEQEIFKLSEQMESAKVIIQQLMSERQQLGRGFKQDKDT